MLGFGKVTSVSIGNHHSYNKNSDRVTASQAQHPQVQDCDGWGSVGMELT